MDNSAVRSADLNDGTSRPVRRFFRAESGQHAAAALVLALFMSIVFLGGQVNAYDGPVFLKGAWLFQRSTESVTRHWLLPNARRVKVDPPVVRCVNPTEAMIETFRASSVGSCQSTPPEIQETTFTFAQRCDYLGPVRTVITVQGETSYRETNELLSSPSPKVDIVVARRIGDCGSTAELGSTDVAAVARGALAEGVGPAIKAVEALPIGTKN